MFPSDPRTITLPAIPRSRSNQVCHRPPPYVSTPTCKKPSPCFLLTGLIRKQGESVCAPIIDTGLPGRHFFPMAKATMVEPFLVRKYFPPGTHVDDHDARSYHGLLTGLLAGHQYVPHLDLLKASSDQLILHRSHSVKGCR